MKIYRGTTQFSTELREKLVAATANDNAVTTNTCDANRFASLESVDEWVEQGRSPVCFLDDSGELQAFGWTGKKQHTATPFDYTVAMRTYEGLRGKGVSAYLLALVLENQLIATPEAMGFWAEINENNTPSIKMCERAGFQLISAINGKQILGCSREVAVKALTDILHNPAKPLPEILKL